MAIQFPCKSCGQTLSVADEHAGKQARCPSCTTVQPVPGGASSSPSTGFGGSIFDPLTPSPSNPAPSNPASSDSLFGPLSPMPPAAPSSNSGGGLFDGLGADKKEPTPPLPSSNASDSTSIFGALPSQSSSFGSSTGNSDASSSSQADMYYLEAPGGSVYGPVDWRTLVAWKNQGRVGPGFRIRKGENGAWQVASSTDLYASTANPFSDTVPGTSQNPVPQYSYPYSQQDRSGLILVLGILAWVLMFGCGPFATIMGILAWVFGAQDLAAARQGRLDPRTLTTIQIGYYLGMIQVLLSVLCFGGYMLIVVVSFLSSL